MATPSTLESLRAAGPALGAATRKLDALRQIRSLMGSPPGSNNWVVDGAHTDIGQAFVANDPHLPLNYPSNFHLSHLIGTEDSLNVQGAIFPGVPATLIGRGAHVGWGVTVVGYDVTDLYVETLTAAPDGSPAVSFNGQPVKIIAVPQTYRFRTATGLATLTDAPVGEGLPAARADHRGGTHGDHRDQRAVDRAGDAHRRPARLPPPEQRGQRRRCPPGAGG